MQELFDAVRRFAPHVRTLLVTGETGTGKELVAHALHTLGARADRRFVTVNCSAVVEALFESELFGHQRGAFTGATDTKVGLFEHADKGTLFLDEIGELPLTIQAKLLRAVEYGEVQRVGSLEAKHVDVTVIAATNRDLRADAANGRFRSDLYYRLSVMEIHLVPLRERREDIPYLSAVFLREVTDRLKRPLIGMTAAAERTLLQAPWPGNVRELRNVIERACLLSDGKMLSERDVLAAMPPAIDTPTPPVLTESALAASASTWDPAFLTNAQRAQVEHALREARGNKAAAARLLGISRRSMFRWLKRLNLSQPTARTKERLTATVPATLRRATRGARACHPRRAEARHTRHARGCTGPSKLPRAVATYAESLSACATSGASHDPAATLPFGWLPPCSNGFHVTTTGSQEPKEIRVKNVFVRSSMIVALTVTTAGLASAQEAVTTAGERELAHNSHGGRVRSGADHGSVDRDLQRHEHRGSHRRQRREFPGRQYRSIERFRHAERLADWECGDVHAPLASPTWAVADVSWGVAAFTAGTAVAGTLAATAVAVATCAAAVATCGTTGSTLVFTLAPKTTVTRSGNHTLTMTWKFASIG